MASRKKIELNLYAVDLGHGDITTMVSVEELAAWLKAPVDPTKNYDHDTLVTVGNFFEKEGRKFTQEIRLAEDSHGNDSNDSYDPRLDQEEEEEGDFDRSRHEW